jgi:hypothetical protein
VTTQSGKPIAAEQCLWLIDGRAVGTGSDLWITAPRPGKHRCRLIVRDAGGQVEANAAFETISDIGGEGESV